MNFRLLWVFVTALFSAFAANAAVITSFNPTFGSTNDPFYITIEGSGFLAGGGVATIKFNGVTSTDYFVSTDNTLFARVRPGTTNGAGPIILIVAAQQTETSTNFTVIGPGPYISGFTPSFGGSGSNLVNISGTHFTGATAVRFNGVNAASYFVSTDSDIQAVTPNGVTTGPITVIRTGAGIGNGTNTSATNFYVTPIIKSFSPSMGRVNTNVIIRGTNFIGTTNVLFGGINVPTNGFTVLSNTAIAINVPTNAITGPLQVRTVAGAGNVSSITTTNFRMQPAIYSFSPAFGPTGTVVVITGANLNERVGGPLVTVNGSNMTVGAFSATTITSTVPANATSGPLMVTTTNGSISTTQSFFVAASIASFTPTKGDSNTWVKITGANFTNASAVTFNGVAATTFVVTNNTTIGARPPVAVTTGPIAITTPGGTATTSSNFFGAPLIDSFNPTTGLAGTNVAIFGMNFTGTTSVLFNGVSAASFSNVHGGQVNAVVPGGAQTGPITIITPGGTNSSLADFIIGLSNNVGVTITDAPDPVFIGSNLVYTINIFNSGPVAATNVTLTNPLPATVTLKSAATTQGTLVTNSTLVRGNLGPLGVGGNATVTVIVAPQASGSITSTVWVFGNYSDPALANNTNSATTLVWPFPVLSIEPLSTNQVRVSWPALLSNFTLQSRSSSIVNGLPWSNDTAPRTITATNVFVIQTNLAPPKFFRLTN